MIWLKTQTKFAEEIPASKQAFFTVYMSNRNRAYNLKVIAGSWKRAGIFIRNQLLTPSLDEVLLTNVKRQVTENAKNSLSTDQAKLALDFTH